MAMYAELGTWAGILIDLLSILLLEMYGQILELICVIATGGPLLRATMDSDITLAIDGGSTTCWTYGFSQAQRLYSSAYYISQGQLVVRRSMIDSMAKFRLGNHNLHVGSSGRRAGPNRKPYSQRLCNRCHNSVDDELHMVFECPVFECVRTHSYFTELFVNTAEHKDMESFIHHTSVRKVAFFIDICLRAIDSQDLNRYITDALRHFHFVGQAARRLAVPM